MERLFAYGTLLNEAVQRSVIGRRIDGTPDAIEGYVRTSLRDGTYRFPNLVPHASGRVEGRVLEVRGDELARIDQYEGDLYRRERVTLASGTEAWVYFGISGP